MWLPGHLAVAFLICIPLLLYSRSKGEEPILPIIYVAFFAVFPDFLHIGDFRMVSHSLIGLSVLVLIGLVILSLISEVRKSLVAIASVAVAAHLFGDWMYGHFFPFFPISTEYVSLNTFNTFMDVRAEILLFAFAAVVFCIFTVSGHYNFVRIRTDLKTKRGFLVLLLPFLAMTALETVYFAQNMTIVGVSLSRLILLVIFAVLLVVTLLTAKKGLERSA